MIYIWLIALVAFVLFELNTTHLVSIWFALGALIAMIGANFEVSIYMQWLLFLIVSGVAIMASRPLSKKYLKTKTVHTNLDRIIHKHGLVTKTITADSRGEVKVMSMIWSATSIDNKTIEEGQHCKIEAVEGSHLVVCPIKN